MKTAIVLILLALSASGWMQTLPLEEPYPKEEETKPEKTAPATPTFDMDFQQFRKTREQVLPQRQFLELALEGEIDSTQYILGPGDQLLIKVWGVIDEQVIAPVTPEGYVVIPTVAEVKVGDRTLAEAGALIKSRLAKTFKNSRFTVRLIQMRKFRVYVTGEIEQAGTYFVRAADRLLDVIQLAGGLRNWANDTRIEIRHAGGAADTVNINVFYLAGDLAQNPTLHSGDVVYIPSIDLRKNYAIVEGNVESQGIYQTLPDETLLAFLNRLRAINRQADIEEVILVRREEKRIYNLLKEGNDAAHDTLQSGDRLMIPPRKDRVYVRGEVRNPGSFPYLANYQAIDYAGFAGGLATSKSLNTIYVVRGATGEVEKGGDVIVKEGDVVVVPQRNREAIRDFVTIFASIFSIVVSTIAITRTSR